MVAVVEGGSEEEDPRGTPESPLIQPTTGARPGRPGWGPGHPAVEPVGPDQGSDHHFLPLLPFSLCKSVCMIRR